MSSFWLKIIDGVRLSVSGISKWIKACKSSKIQKSKCSELESNKNTNLASHSHPIKEGLKDNNLLEKQDRKWKEKQIIPTDNSEDIF